VGHAWWNTALYRSLTKAVILEGTEEEHVAEDSPVKYCPPSPNFKPDKTAIFFLQFTSCGSLFADWWQEFPREFKI
jgi:hypothetical protein